MKNLIYIVLLSVLPMLTYAQIDVVAPDGNVGIGTANPQGKLHVYQPVPPLGSNGLPQKPSTPGMIIENGYLGVGIAPERVFHIRDNRALFRIDRQNYPAGFMLCEWNSNYSSVTKSFGVLGGDYFTIAEFRKNSAPSTGGPSFRRMVIDTDGDVILPASGVNSAGSITSTTHKLYVEGSAFKSDANPQWTIASDERLKKNIKTYKGGLDLITELNPISYEYNGRGGTKAGMKRIGVTAQELQKIAPHMVSTFKIGLNNDDGIEYADGAPEGSEISTTEEEYLSINTSSLQWVLVNAIKEQQETIESQDEKIATLEERLDKMEALINNSTTIPSASQTVELSGSSQLLQNQPNPFSETTTIKYTLPQDVQNAKMQITDMNGKVIKTVQLSDTQDGQLIIKAGQLGSGTYSYSLIVDGQILSTKKMVLTK